MAQWSTGTVTVANDSATVTGVGTSWLSSGASPGVSIFVVTGTSASFIVTGIASDTSLTLHRVWPGTSSSGLSYILSLDGTPRYNLPLLDETDVEMPALINTAFDIIDSVLP